MRISLFVLFLLISFISFSQNTFVSVQDGDWNDASTWTLGAGAGGTEGIDFPAASDIVTVDHFVIIDATNNGTNFSFTGKLTINADDTLESQVGNNVAGFVLEGNGLMINNGSFFTLDATEEPDEFAHIQYEFVCKGNSVFIGGINSFAFISDDWQLEDNAQVFIDNLNCYAVSDDVNFESATCNMYGTGNIRIGGDGAGSTVNFNGGSSAAQLDDDITIWRNVASLDCSGTAVTTGTSTDDIPPFALDDSYTTAVSTAQDQAVLIQGIDDFSPVTGDVLTITSAGDDAGATNGATIEGGTVTVNNNGTAGDPTDDYIVYTPLAGFIGTDTYNYLITNTAGETSIAEVTVTINECGAGFIADTSPVYATFESEVNNVIDETEAEGAPDGNFAQIYANNEQLILDMGQIYTAGTQYEITWRVRTSQTGDAVIDLSESTLAGSGFTAHPTLPTTTDNVNFVTTTVTSNVDFRYLAFDKGNTDNTDYDLDAVTINETSCLPDNDNDGISDEDDIDDDNDGILDVDEGCTITSPITYPGVVDSQSGVANNGDVEGAPDGNAAEWYSNAGDIMIFDFGSIFPAGTQYVFTWRARTGGGTGTATMILGESNTAGSFTLHSNPPTTVGNTFVSDTVTSENSFRFIEIEKSVNPDWEIDAIGIMVPGSGVQTCTLDSDNDGVDDVFDLDSDGDGIADIVEAGGIDTDGNGVVDVFADSDGDGWATTFDNVGEAGTPLTDPDTDGDGFENRIDIDSDDDGIIDIIESQPSGVLISPSGTDTDGDGIDDNFDPDSGNTLTTPENTDGVDNPDYTDTDSDNDGDLDILEGWDTDNDGVADTTPAGADADNDGLDDNYDNIVGPNNTTNVTNNGQNSSTFPNLDNTTTTELDWREAIDTDGDGVTDIDDVDDDNDGIPDLDECGVGVTASNPFTSLGQARNVGVAKVYYFDLGGVTFSTYVDESGYVQIATDFGDGAGNLPQGTTLTNLTRGILSPTALATLGDLTSIRISHSGGVSDVTTTNATLLARILTNTVLHEGIGDNTINDDWVGTNSAAFIEDGTGNSPRGSELHQNIMHPSGNTSAFHWMPSNNTQRNIWTLGEIPSTESLTLWVRADEVVVDCSLDTDNDGVVNRLDPDSDGDGIADIIEAGGVDADGDGVVDGVFADTDGDGWSDTFDPNDSGTALVDEDEDGDGFNNRIDIDSDDDGIIDIIESQPSGVLISPSGTDMDGDGIDDNFDPDSGNTLTDPENTDGTDNPDYTDTNSDNDGDLDRFEAWDSDNDGVMNVFFGGTDTDQDGLDDNYDNIVGPNSTTNVTNSGQSSTTFPNLDNTSTTERDWREVDDNDNDGILDVYDLDDDNDGIPDLIELDCTSGNADLVFSTAGTVSFSAQALGDFDVLTAQINTGDVLTIDLTDTVPEGEVVRIRVLRENTNRFLLQGTVDNIVFTNDVTYGNSSADNDMPVVSQFYDFLYEVGAGGARFLVFTREVGSTRIDGVSYAPQCTVLDSDGDGIEDQFDLDSDNDGIPDIVEAGGEDTDGNGLVDDINVNGTLTADTDEDGLADVYDSNNSGTDITSVDTDGDGINDAQDLDADNDGIPDVVEAGGTDENGDGRADDYVDTDGDGFNDVVDGDVGQDGTSENTTNALTVTGTDTGTDGIPDSYPNDDTDGDGILNALDLDADNDGIPDVVEAGGTDEDGDGIADDYVDADLDGFNDVVDGDPTNALAVGTDTDGLNSSDALTVTGADSNLDGIPDSYPNDDNDGDGILNQLDLDADNDGIADVVEAGGADENGDGRADNYVDADSDGFNDIVDGDVGNDGTAENSGNATTLTAADGNGDGAPDSYPNDDFDGDEVYNFLDLDADDDGIMDVVEAGGSDTNRDAIEDSFVDVDGDGFNDNVDGDSDNSLVAGDDTVEADAANATTLTDEDADLDGVPDDYPNDDFDDDGHLDYLDIDADNDGIVDNTEGQPTATYVAPANADADRDGIDDAYDDLNGFGGTGAVGYLLSDIDGTENPDYLDLDTDNDGDLDEVEGHDTDNDGIADGSSIANTGLPGGTTDTDGDGLLDGYDNNTSSQDPTNGGFEGEDYTNIDNPNTTESDWREVLDNDNDGIADVFDLDDDNDGIPDAIELDCTSGNADLVFSTAGTVSFSAQALGDFDASTAQINTGDVLTIDLTDTVPEGDVVRIRVLRENTNRFLLQGTVDNIVFTNDVTYGNSSADNDMPVVSQFYDFLYPVGAGGARFLVFTREVGSSRIDGVSYAPQCAVIDTDGDGIEDQFDLDSDNDGIPDIVEAGGEDTEGDGRVDDLTGTTLTNDTDGDGLDDRYDSGNGGDDIINGDTDGDGINDVVDLDADNDGIPDVVEAGGTDENGDGRADDYVDADADGFNDVVDGDVGNDGTAENTSDALTVTGDDANDDGIPDTYPNDDTDGDGIVNALDLDADNDGIPDVVEAGGTDQNGDGRADDYVDADLDGFNDVVDGDPTNALVVGTDTPGANTSDALTLTDEDANLDGEPDSYPNDDFDGDNVYNFLDLDADGDGILDVLEAGGTDTDSDGQEDGYVDVDLDGFNDLVDGDPDNSLIAGDDSNDSNTASATTLTGPDSDGDGIPNSYPNDDFDGDTKVDYLDIDADNDGIVDNTEAQLTSGYLAPLNTDVDGDGIDTRYDANDGIFGSTGSGLTPVDTDVASEPDSPDYVDVDSENDGISDLIEGHDTDGDELADASSPANTGEPGGIIDVDNDGLLDGFDNNTSSTDATNGNLQGLSHPNITNPITTERDWREVSDRDNDGISDAQDIDDDNDGILDEDECAATPKQSVIFTYTGADQSYTVPAGATEIRAKVWGAGGRGDEQNGRGVGGAGGYTEITIPVSSLTSTTMVVTVGEGGNSSTGGDRTYGNGGAGSEGTTNSFRNFGAGGGMSAISYSTINEPDTSIDPILVNSEIIAIAGGGGTMPAYSNGGTQAGDGGGTSGSDATDGTVGLNGLGGNQVAGGASTNGDPGGYLYGGNSGLDRGAGGGGYYGGGAGSFISNNEGGGGGGSAYISNTTRYGQTLRSTTIQIPPRNTDPDYIAGVGVGGNSNSGDGGNGLVVISAIYLDCDEDGDGITNQYDLDSDGDGIPDILEAGGVDADDDGRVDGFTDNDGDGWADTFDPDDSGIPLEDGDKDGDGFKNRLDLDADDDGIADIIEAGGVDTDGDGMVDSNTDTDNDGWANTFDSDDGGVALPVVDTDSDGNENYLDIDSDNDGIIDNIEGQTTASFVVPSGVDFDNDGWDDRYDGDVTAGTNGTPIVLSNNDGAGDGADYIDLNSDTDAQPDWLERADDDADGDALLDLIVLADAYETTNGNPNHYVSTDDADGDDIPDFAEDDDGDGNVEASDSDGIPNFLDPNNVTHYRDTDNDGLVDFYDADHNGDNRDNVNQLSDLDNNGAPDFRDAANDVTLPIQLIEFKATKVGAYVQLDWKTATEINNDYFTIERSIDGENFEEILTQQGAGNSSSINNYRRYDEQPEVGYNYYKLTQTDFNGQSESFNIEVVKFDGDGVVKNNASVNMNVYPNPSEGERLTLAISTLKAGNCKLEVITARGKLISQQEINSDTEQVNYQVELLQGISLASGTYYLKVISNEEVEVLPFIIK